MEAIIWITAAVVIYLMGRKHCNEEKNHAEWKWKAYIAGSLLAAVLCEIGIKAVFHIHYLSIWLVSEKTVPSAIAMQPDVVACDF